MDALAAVIGVAILMVMCRGIELQNRSNAGADRARIKAQRDEGDAIIRRNRRSWNEE